jgi:LPS-assembly lipoprotein
MMSGVLAACQVRPLYSETAGTTEKLASVNFSPATDRVTQAVRNHLVFLATGGAGEAAKKDYDVRLSVTSTATTTEISNDNDLQVSTYSGSYPGRVVLTAQYALVENSDGKILRAAKRTVTAMVDLPQQEFARIRAIRDAENRAARELAEVIRTDIAATLSR